MGRPKACSHVIPPKSGSVPWAGPRDAPTFGGDNMTTRLGPAHGTLPLLRGVGGIPVHSEFHYILVLTVRIVVLFVDEPSQTRSFIHE